METTHAVLEMVDIRVDTLVDVLLTHVSRCSASLFCQRSNIVFVTTALEVEVFVFVIVFVTVELCAAGVAVHELVVVITFVIFAVTVG